jgi:hypothetical protein
MRQLQHTKHPTFGRLAVPKSNSCPSESGPGHEHVPEMIFLTLRIYNGLQLFLFLREVLLRSTT